MFPAYHTAKQSPVVVSSCDLSCSVIRLSIGVLTLTHTSICSTPSFTDNERSVNWGKISAVLIMMTHNYDMSIKDLPSLSIITTMLLLFPSNTALSVEFNSRVNSSPSS